MAFRVGIIGYGYWGPKLMRNFARSPDFEVFAMADRQHDARQRAAAASPGLLCLEDGEELIRRGDIDVVVIATPVTTHFPLARAALLAGKHVLVEKPLCRSASECEELVALSARAGRVLMVDHTFLYTGAVEAIRQSVETGRLGKICHFDSVRVNLGLFRSDVNCLWDLAPHDLSIIDCLVDDEVVEIDISGHCHVTPGVADTIYMTLHYARNMVAHLSLSWMSPVKVRRVAVGGTRQTVIWDDLDPDQKLRIYESGIQMRPDEERAQVTPDYRLGDIIVPRLSRREALAGVVEHFAAVIKGQEAQRMGGAQALKVVRVLERAQHALDRNLARVAKARSEA